MPSAVVNKVLRSNSIVRLGNYRRRRRLTAHTPNPLPYYDGAGAGHSPHPRTDEIKHAPDQQRDRSDQKQNPIRARSGKNRRQRKHAEAAWPIANAAVIHPHTRFCWPNGTSSATRPAATAKTTPDRHTSHSYRGKRQRHRARRNQRQSHSDRLSEKTGAKAPRKADPIRQPSRRRRTQCGRNPQQHPIVIARRNPAMQSPGNKIHPENRVRDKTDRIRHVRRQQPEQDPRQLPFSARFRRRCRRSRRWV